VAKLSLPVALAILSTPFGLLRPNTMSGTKFHAETDSESDLDSESDPKQNPSRMGHSCSDSEITRV